MGFFSNPFAGKNSCECDPNAVGNLAQRVATLEGTATSHETKIATLEQDVAGLKQANTTLQSGVEELNTTTARIKVIE